MIEGELIPKNQTSREDEAATFKAGVIRDTNKEIERINKMGFIIRPKPKTWKQRAIDTYKRVRGLL